MSEDNKNPAVDEKEEDWVKDVPEVKKGVEFTDIDEKDVIKTDAEFFAKVAADMEKEGFDFYAFSGDAKWWESHDKAVLKYIDKRFNAVKLADSKGEKCEAIGDDVIQAWVSAKD